MIICIVGNTGSGKTYLLVRTKVDEVGHTDRFVVSNVTETKWGKLNAYIQKKFPRLALDLDERLKIIPKAKTFDFYRHRSGGLVLDPLPPTKDAYGKRTSKEDWLAKADNHFKKMEENPEWQKPVTYLISEAHEYFPAREWDELGRAVTFYCSKHRHLHDEIVFETQNPEQLDSSLRRLIAEYWYVENRYQKSLGPFAAKGCFRVKKYYQMPGPTTQPFEMMEFKLEADGIGDCYDSTGALGLMQRGPENKGHRKKKLPWWTIYGGAVAMCVGLYFLISFVPVVIGKGMGTFFKGASDGLRPQIEKTMGAASPAAAARGNRSPHLQQNPVDAGGVAHATNSPAGVSTVAHSSSENEEQIEAVGYVIEDGKPVVLLADETVLTMEDGIRTITKKEVVMFDGTRYPIRKPVLKVEAPWGAGGQIGPQ